MAIKLNNMGALQNHFDCLINKAIKETCKILEKELTNIIKVEYYDVYKPKLYERSEQFLNSAVAEIVAKNCGRIFMNPHNMNYPFNGSGRPWSGTEQIESANEGLHGGMPVPNSNHRYWDVFMEYCDRNAIPILKEELRKQGLKIY